MKLQLDRTHRSRSGSTVDFSGISNFGVSIVLAAFSHGDRSIFSALLLTLTCIRSVNLETRQHTVTMLIESVVAFVATRTRPALGVSDIQRHGCLVYIGL